MGLLDRPQDPQRFGLLSPDVMRLIQAGASQPQPVPQPPARAPRERAGFWRTLDGIFQPGGTVSSSLDAERARLQAEADAPAMATEQNRLRGLAAGFGPMAELGFALNPGETGKAFASNLEGYTLGAGGVRGGATGPVMSAPTFRDSGDETLRMDPLTGAVTPVYTRTAPSIQETTAQGVAATGAFNAEQGAREFDQRIGLDRQEYELQAELGRGRLGLDRDKLADEQRTAAETQQREQAERAAAATAASGAVAASAANMGRATTGARRFIGAAGVWNSRNPLEAQNRANLDGFLDTLRANLTFENLAAMKAQSAVGASGLGALSEKEAVLLSSTAASLSIDMDSATLEQSLAVIDGLVAKMRDESGTPDAPSGRRLSPQEAAQLPSGTRFVGTDGVERVTR